MKQRRNVMLNDPKKTTSLIPPLDDFEGYVDSVEGEEVDQGGSIIRDTRRIKFCNDNKWRFADDDTEIPADREFIAAKIVRLVQKFIDGAPADDPTSPIVLKPGEKFPDIKAMNEKAPQEEWGEDFNGDLCGPWVGQSIIYMLDPVSMGRFSFVARLTTVGSTVAVRELARSIADRRRMYGETVYPKVRLGDTLWSKRYGRQRPDFIIVGWVGFGGDGGNQALPAPTNPTLLPADMKEAAKAAEPVEASLKEDLQDEIPSDGSAGKSDRANPDSRAPMKKKAVNQKRAAKQPASERARSRA
jgi:hypothetical protein